MKFKILSFVLLTFIFVQSVPVIALAGTDISVYVNAKKVDFPDQKPYLDKNNRTLVPVRFVSEALGAKVGWNNSTQTVTIEQEEKVITLKIGESKATVNGVTKYFDSAAVLTGKQRTMVPLRFVSETLGAKVQWVGAENTVYISTTGEFPVPQAKEFEGEPFKPFDSYVANPGEDPAKIQISYITIDQLPAKVGIWTIHSLTVGTDKIEIKQSGNKKPIDIALVNAAKTEYRVRQGTGEFASEPYTKSYPVQYVVDEIVGYAKADISKVEYIYLLADRANWGNQILAVKNPLYKK